VPDARDAPTLVIGDHRHEMKSLPRRALQLRHREREGAIARKQDHGSFGT